MGSLKAIADNQHVKYVIFTRYAQNGRVKRGKKPEAEWTKNNHHAQPKSDTNAFSIFFFTFLAFL